MDIFERIGDFLPLIILIIIGLSQYFTAKRAEKRQGQEFPDADETPDIDEVIRRLQEQERSRQQQPPVVPPPLPKQQPPATVRRNSIPQASSPHPATLTKRAAQSEVDDAFEVTVSSAYDIDRKPHSAKDRNFPRADGRSETAQEIEHLKKQAEAFQIHSSRQQRGSEKKVTAGWRGLLGNPSSVRDAVILREILGPPCALRRSNDVV